MTTLFSYLEEQQHCWSFTTRNYADWRRRRGQDMHGKCHQGAWTWIFQVCCFFYGRVPV